MASIYILKFELTVDYLNLLLEDQVVGLDTLVDRLKFDLTCLSISVQFNLIYSPYEIKSNHSQVSEEQVICI